jgi:parallel beta-helix repeat protein
MAINRRTFLGAAASWPWLAGCAFAIATPTIARASGASVRSHGARGDGTTDDTDAFQQAIDAAGQGGGGIVTVPAGRYLLDPLRSVRLRSGVHLQMDAAATLLAKPNAEDRSVLLLVQDASDVTITGGRLLGERDRHLGTTGEWGHGIQLRGAQRVTLRDIHVSNFWGDGLSVAAINPTRANPDTAPSTDVLLERIVSLGNRRQGLTIGRSSRVRVIDCEFAGTGGTAPEAGIDIEPDTGAGAQDIEIANCRIHDNHGPGIQVWKRAHHVRIHDCTLQDNRYGVLVVGAEDTSIIGNRILGNALNGVVLRKGANGATISGNHFSDNAHRMGALARLPSLGGGVPERHVRVEPDAQGVRIGQDNRYD